MLVSPMYIPAVSAVRRGPLGRWSMTSISVCSAPPRSLRMQLSGESDDAQQALVKGAAVLPEPPFSPLHPRSLYSASVCRVPIVAAVFR